MTRILVTIVLATGTSLVHAADAAPAPAPDLAAEARGLAAELGTRLRAELQAAMQAGGPVNAINTCNEKALPIAVELGEKAGWEVGRTSLKVRNPDNAPDTWERTVLDSFTARVAAGESAAGLEQQATITVGDKRYFRFMKAIPTGEVCTVCHGTSVAPDIQARLHALYPDDRATGYKAGDLRGAFTLTRKLD